MGLLAGHQLHGETAAHTHQMHSRAALWLTWADAEVVGQAPAVRALLAAGGWQEEPWLAAKGTILQQLPVGCVQWTNSPGHPAVAFPSRQRVLCKATDPDPSRVRSTRLDPTFVLRDDCPLHD